MINRLFLKNLKKDSLYRRTARGPVRRCGWPSKTRTGPHMHKLAPQYEDEPPNDATGRLLLRDGRVGFPAATASDEARP